MPGVRIGDGAVIGGQAVVTKNVAPYAMVGGNPARLIRHRFDRRTIALLLELRWWDWPDERVEFCIPHLLSDDVDGLLAAARRLDGVEPPATLSPAGDAAASPARSRG